MKLQHAWREVTLSKEVNVLKVDLAFVLVVLWVVLKVDQIFVRDIS